uniref:Uncharacterized protein n=1 Tax=Meloidogyne incognita TaxID=6306 RepID=A0A914MBR6_MELIC
MDSSNRETFFQFLAHCNKGMAREIGNLINKIVKSDLGEGDNSRLISRLCCWTLTTFIINALLLLDGEDIVKIGNGINLIDTNDFLNKILTENEKDSTKLTKIKQILQIVVENMKKIFPSKTFFDGGYAFLLD